MKTMTRKQLAEHAGVTTQTLKNWMGPHLDYLHSIGMPTGKGALPPNVVKYIVDTFDIDKYQKESLRTAKNPKMPLENVVSLPSQTRSCDGE